MLIALLSLAHADSYNDAQRVKDAVLLNPDPIAWCDREGLICKKVEGDGMSYLVTIDTDVSSYVNTADGVRQWRGMMIIMSGDVDGSTANGGTDYIDPGITGTPVMVGRYAHYGHSVWVANSIKSRPYARVLKVIAREINRK